ncbi:MAG: DUF1559 domain-containing protein [Planctomycetaceae bacterium]|nr:DUF1559 domain-containing protein [Planctomycetaceae bacterium]
MSDSQPIETGEIQEKKRKRLFSRLGCIVILLLLGGSFALLYHVAHEAHEAAKRMQCVPKQLACALWNYQDTYKSFPPAYTTDAEGNPLHSWRVLLLPYIEKQRLYDEIHLDEPWDSPYNSQFHDQMPRNYHCPSRPAEETAKGLSPYQMIIGPDTISNGPNSTKLSDITKDKSEVILVVETSVPVPWMKPEDLPQSVLKNGVVSSVPQRGQPVVQGIGSPHRSGDGANVAMVDTSCLYFTTAWSPEELLEKSRIR